MIRHSFKALALALLLGFSSTAAQAQIDQDQALLAIRTIMQFDFNTKVTARAYKVLLDQEKLSAATPKSHSLGFFSDNEVRLDPVKGQIRYHNVSKGATILVTLQKDDYQVWVNFPERHQPYYFKATRADLRDRFQLAKIKDLAKHQIEDGKYQAWRNVPDENGVLPAVPAPSKILASDYYYRLLKDGVLDIRIAYGYLDHEPSNEPTDYLQARELRGKLRQAGFGQVGSDEWKLEKTFTYGLKPIVCRVEIAHAAVPEKLGEKVQLAQSLKARDLFMDGLKHADVIMYDGHSRLGRGPDFTPLEERKSPGNIKIGNMVPFYLEFGDNLLIRFAIPFTGGKDLKDEVFAKGRYQILVMDSCKSEAYYRRKVLRDAIKYSGKTDESLDLITTDTDSDMGDSIHTKLGIIRGLMAQKTAPELMNDLNTGAVTKYNTTGLFIDSDVETPFDEHLQKRNGQK